MARQATVACAVTAAHLLFFALICIDIRPNSTAHAGAYGTTVTLSLVDGVSQPQTSKTAAASPPPAKKTKTVADAKAAEPAEAPQATADSEVTPPDDVAAAAEASPLSTADITALAAFQMPTSSGEPGQACNLTALLATGFATSPAVSQGLAGLPNDQRSVANAVMLWDGGWPDDTHTGGKALLRALLIKAVSSAPQPCLDQAQRGPVLFFVPDNGTTAVLAIGSGEWRWGDLIAPDAAGIDGNYFLTLASGSPTTP
ncbi:hypothetical protein ABAC460_09150 [Asticcacaulis sp. AC460]|uniref:hypothetical protein n=1 Tax=Asticcacaulis sp. AC460 TaxID=1282360 RepID=UPI0003C3ACAE|nr:hypothetical protein [Asticcacaulis sp. AC460]ESQ90311.1 hypothetical protein ABAC460_09150 [Asticcacaulis sp. AC460]